MHSLTLTHKHTHVHTHALTHALTHSLTQLLAKSITKLKISTHSLIRSLSGINAPRAHSLTHSLTLWYKFTHALCSYYLTQAFTFTVTSLHTHPHYHTQRHRLTHAITHTFNIPPPHPPSLSTHTPHTLAKARKFGHKVLAGLAAKHGRSEAQIMIRWSLQKG